MTVLPGPPVAPDRSRRLSGRAPVRPAPAAASPAARPLTDPLAARLTPCAARGAKPRLRSRSGARRGRGAPAPHAGRGRTESHPVEELRADAVELRAAALDVREVTGGAYDLAPRRALARQQCGDIPAGAGAPRHEVTACAVLPASSTLAAPEINSTESSPTSTRSPRGKVEPQARGTLGTAGAMTAPLAIPGHGARRKDGPAGSRPRATAVRGGRARPGPRRRALPDRMDREGHGGTSPQHTVAARYRGHVRTTAAPG